MPRVVTLNVVCVTFRPAKPEIFTASPDVGPKASEAGNLQRLDPAPFTLYTILFSMSPSPHKLSVPVRAEKARVLPLRGSFPTHYSSSWDVAGAWDAPVRSMNRQQNEALQTVKWDADDIWDDHTRHAPHQVLRTHRGATGAMRTFQNRSRRWMRNSVTGLKAAAWYVLNG